MPRARNLWVLAFVVGVPSFFVWAAAPRHADLAAFDPARVARSETAMWRNYYEKRYVALFADLYSQMRDEYGFSPLDSARLAFHAARAASIFQPTATRAQASAALPELRAYFDILAEAARVFVDTNKLAAMELDWWQARREGARAEVYGLTIARTSALLYGVDNDALRRAGVERAQAMDFRDAHDSDIDDATWAEIAGRLTRAWGDLKMAISASGPSTGPSTARRLSQE